MSGAKILLFATTVAVVVSFTSVATSAVAPPPVVTPTCLITVGLSTSVNCTGTIAGLPPGITHVQLTLAYNCVNRFHTVPTTSVVGSDIQTDAHGKLTFDLTALASPCQVGLTPVPQNATITAAQNGNTLVSVVVPL